MKRRKEQIVPRATSSATRASKWLDSSIDGAIKKYEESGEEWTAAAKTLFDPWAQFIVPDFPLDILPPAIQDFVVAEARVIGCDISTMGMSVMCTFSGAINHSTSLEMMRHGQWYASPRLWVLLVGDPSKKKTPAINCATTALEAYQEKQWRKYKLELQMAEESDEKKRSIRQSGMLFSTPPSKSSEKS